jgi:penicillin-binding protein 1A
MTIRLAQQLGMKTVVEYAEKFGITDHMEPHLFERSWCQRDDVAAPHCRLRHDRQWREKKLRRLSSTGCRTALEKTIERTDGRDCQGCGPLIRWENQATPDIADPREMVGDPRTAYQMVSILEGVVQRGTAKALAKIDYPLGGKTGTTNDSKDVWFVGFTPDLVAGVYIGFDEPKSLGAKETGGSTAVPVFKEFMEGALKDMPPAPFRVPPGVRMVQVNARSGQPTYADDPDAIWEPFLSGTEPTASDYVPGPAAEPNDGEIYNPYATTPSENLEPGQAPPSPGAETGMDGTGGLY